MRYCPVCQKSAAMFGVFGYSRREDACCPNCRSLERHRLTWLFFGRYTDLFTSAKLLLHVAPEPCFEPLLRKRLGDRYITASIDDENVNMQVDITHMPHCADGRFGAIYCSHVLEHIPDDRAAMRELYRVLNVDGWAILLVPVIAEKTEEDLNASEEEKIIKFGHPGHVRAYGPDYEDRLKECGFKVQKYERGDFITPDELVEMAVTEHSGDIYYCTKE